METASVIKERLHDLINEINDLDNLKAIEKMLIECFDELKLKNGEHNLFTEPDAKYIKDGAYVHNPDDNRECITDDEILKMLKDREARYVSGKDKAYSIEEFKAKFEKEHGL